MGMSIGRQVIPSGRQLSVLLLTQAWHTKLRNGKFTGMSYDAQVLAAVTWRTSTWLVVHLTQCACGFKWLRSHSYNSTVTINRLVVSVNKLTVYRFIAFLYSSIKMRIIRFRISEGEVRWSWWLRSLSLALFSNRCMQLSLLFMT